MSDQNSEDSVELNQFDEEIGEDKQLPTAPEQDRTATDLEAIFDVPVTVSAILGRSMMDVSELLNMEEGSIIPLDRKVGEAIDIFVNNRHVARGEVVMSEGRLGVTMTEIIKSET